MLACFAIDGGVARERRLWRTPPKNRRIVCTKFPDETDFAAAMLACDSDLHVIFIVHDPRDVVVSRHHASPGRYLTNLRVWRQNYTAARPYFDHPRFHVVRYRDLVRDPDAVQRRLGAAMPFLEPVRPFSRYLECSRDEDGAWLRGMDMDLRPVCPDSIANWRAHPGRVKGQIMRHGDISAELIALGFEDNADWQGLLAGAIPDFSPGAAVEHAGGPALRPLRQVAHSAADPPRWLVAVLGCGGERGLPARIASLDACANRFAEPIAEMGLVEMPTRTATPPRCATTPLLPDCARYSALPC
jgi:hypothetical protein